MSNKKAMGMHWFILIMSFYLSIGMIMYYQFIETDIPKVGEYSTIVSKTLEKSSIVPSLIEHVLEDINEQSRDRFIVHTDFLHSLGSYCMGDYEDKWNQHKHLLQDFTIPSKDIEADIEADIEIPEDDETDQEAYCHMDTERAKRRFRIIFGNKYNYFRNLKHNDFNDYSFDLSGLQYDFEDPFEEIEESGEFFIKMTVRDANPGLRFQINKEDGDNIGSYIMRPNFKLPVQILNYNFNKFDNSGTSIFPHEMCLFVAGCADFDDVVERYNLDPNSIKEEPCDYYDRCDAAKEAKDIFEIPYEIIRFLCSGDCEQPACDSDDHTLTQSKLPTNCMDNPCNSYVPGTCDSTSDCGCSNGYSCSGDCVD